MQDNQNSIYGPAEATALERRIWKSIGAGSLKSAISDCETLNTKFPTFAPGWHTASHLLIHVNKPRSALVAIERGLESDSKKPAWLLQRATCLSKLNRIAELSQAVQEISASDMQTPYQLSALAMLKTQLNLRDEALSLYQKSISMEPKQSQHYYNAACMQRSLGDLEKAEDNFDKAIRLNPADYPSYKIRSDLRHQTPDRNHVEELRAQLTTDAVEQRDQLQLFYALAKELEDLGDHDESFTNLQKGSSIRRKLMRYDLNRDIETINAIGETFSADFMASESAGCMSTEPIFILGMPRTGTTLVERILAAHTDVFAAGELNNFAAQLMSKVSAKVEGNRMTRDEIVRTSSSVDFKSLGESYLDSTRPFTGASARFIDKMPLNYLYVGLIHRALPNATIINLERCPMDTIYAVFKQLFVDAYPFSYDLEELARYFVAYHELMQHWNEVLPGVIHTVRYENLVDNIGLQSRELLSACELGWQDRCLKFYENKDASTTASTAQIRRPVYSSSVGKWRRYERQLEPAIRILKNAGIDAFE